MKGLGTSAGRACLTCAWKAGRRGGPILDSTRERTRVSVYVLDGPLCKVAIAHTNISAALLLYRGKTIDTF